MNGIRLPVRVSGVGIVLGALACRPVFVIGWGEWLLLLALVALLLGPILFRFWRTWKARRTRRD